MATGRQNKLVGQTGEYLVASELSRQDLIVTTFTGNVPHYDIIACSAKGKTIPIQVKTIRSENWQFARLDQFVEIKFDGQIQIVGKTLPSPVKNLVFVFVQIATYGSDKFFICTWSELAKIISKNHSEYLAKHNGLRPQKWDSLHTSLNVGHISQFKDRWALIKRLLN